jgi:hypothetical protein
LYAKVGTGDYFIEGDTKGMVLQSPNNTCFLIKLTQLGKLLAIPAACP